MPRESGRHAAGAVLVELLKFLKEHERTRAHALPMSAASRRVLNRHLAPTEWIPLEALQELLAVFDGVVGIKGDEHRALELSTTSGAVMRGLQKAYSVPGDPMASVVAMRHGWRAHYDFGRLTYRVDSDRSVEFTVEDYLDMPMLHGMMTASWGVMAARAAGAANVEAKVTSRPWRGEPALRFVISF